MNADVEVAADLMRYHADIHNEGPRLPTASSVKGPGVRIQQPRDTAGSRYCYTNLTEGHFKGNKPRPPPPKKKRLRGLSNVKRPGRFKLPYSVLNTVVQTLDLIYTETEGM